MPSFKQNSGTLDWSEENFLSENPEFLCNSKPFKIAIEAIISSASEITFLKSHSHKINIEYQNPEKNKAKVRFEQNKEKPNEYDFYLYWRSKNFEIPQIAFGESEKKGPEAKYCALISFVPNFCSMSLEEAYAKEVEARSKNLQVKFPNQTNEERGEYLFLLDRSESMRGASLYNAKRQLISFLRTLPSKTYFNVYSFGNFFSPLYPESLQAKVKNIEHAEKRINTFEADLGLAKLHPLLEEIYNNQAKRNNTPLKILLFTKGVSELTQETKDLLKNL